MFAFVCLSLYNWRMTRAIATKFFLLLMEPQCMFLAYTFLKIQKLLMF